MSRLLGLGVVAGLLALSAPAQAITCFPHVYEQHTTVAGQDVTYVTVRMIC